MKAVSVLEKYCYDLDSSERAMMYYHTLNQSRQFSDFAGRKLLTGEIARVRNEVNAGRHAEGQGIVNRRGKTIVSLVGIESKERPQ